MKCSMLLDDERSSTNDILCEYRVISWVIIMKTDDFIPILENLKFFVRTSSRFVVLVKINDLIGSCG